MVHVGAGFDEMQAGMQDFNWRRFRFIAVESSKMSPESQLQQLIHFKLLCDLIG